ncbi:LuxR C-terminal-related transcriptional regulator [Streptomyces sp. NPDC088752]|uniref:LuxR C-terminal-related transcriptional regulator n=1 Tax=Streptomyces sp. NPDC088752 TaxID=3154963 RepID=UPI00344628F9
MIRAENLTKRYGNRTVVQDLGFTVRPGTVTGFLGPNGAGKSTTLRMILGLDAPTRGRATVDGRPYAHHRAPLARVGALLEARSAHPGRSAHHLPVSPTHGSRPEDPRLAALTDREREILTVIGQGWTNTEIAIRLHLAESTVKTHVGRVLAKTGARDRVQAVILAYDTQLVTPA